MYLLIRKRRILSGLLVAVLLLSFSAAVRFYKTAAVFRPERDLAEVVIDPGHGGVDGGAVAADGTIESGINLAVSLTLKELFLLFGTEPVMTRETDISIHDAGADTIARKKVSDLHNRVALANGETGAVLISIHQNSLPTAPSVHGAQVFFNNVSGAESFASSVQSALNTVVNTDKPKHEKSAPSTIYLMQHTEIPAILVECGFLSNPQETSLLKTQSHQLRLALAVLCGYYAKEDIHS